MRGPGAERSPPEAEAFFVKLHIIFALKYNKQQLLSLESTSMPVTVEVSFLTTLSATGLYTSHARCGDLHGLRISEDACAVPCKVSE